MKFQVLFLLATSLASYACGESVDARSHARDFDLDDIEIVTRDIPFHEFQKRDPTLPTGKDATKLHAWIRLDTRTTSFDDRSGANHDGLNQLIKDTGGRHVDVVVGKPGEYNAYGLMMTSGAAWQKKPNGDGVPVVAYGGPYDAAPGEQFTYAGQIDQRKTLKSIKATG